MCGIPGELQTSPSMQSRTHEVRQGNCDPPEMPASPPSSGIPGGLKLFQRHVARCPVTLPTVANTGGWDASRNEA